MVYPSTLLILSLCFTSFSGYLCAGKLIDELFKSWPEHKVNKIRAWNVLLTVTKSPRISDDFQYFFISKLLLQMQIVKSNHYSESFSVKKKMLS